ncbi:MAG TPA: hypothetical protein VIJ62_01235 [Rhizomicrobium sp.]
MNAPSHEPRPGDLILNRYMLNATEEEREEARENLRAYATVILRIATRLATEEYEQEIRAREADKVSLNHLTSPI